MHLGTGKIGMGGQAIWGVGTNILMFTKKRNNIRFSFFCVKEINFLRKSKI